MNKKHQDYIFKHFIIWIFATTFWAIMREFGQDVVQAYPPLTLFQYARLHFAMSLAASILFGSLEFFFEKKINRNFSFGKSILIGSASYLIATLMLISFGTMVFTKVLQITLSWNFYQEFILSKQTILLIFYCFLVGFLIDFVKQIDKKFGPGNLWRMLKGEFYEPKEAERIFMFLDLKSSTSIAENLGHIKYSKLIQDCFLDLDVVEKYHAEVYQYVGDEVVLTWEKEQGLFNSNCLKSYFDFQTRLSERSEYYLEQYGLVPEFKAGLNMGKIIIAEVGELKREIAYHGDTINTAARIQEQCNALGENLLISESLQDRLVLDATFSSLHVGEVLLKGKANKVNIYRIEAA